MSAATFLRIFVVLVFLPSFQCVQWSGDADNDIYKKVKESTDEIFKNFLADLDESTTPTDFKKNALRPKRSTDPELGLGFDHVGHGFSNGFQNTYPTELRSGAVFSIDFSLAPSTMIKHMDRHYKIWRSFTLNGVQHLVAITGDSMFVHVFNNQPNLYQVYETELQTEDKKFVDIVVTPVNHDGKTTLCIVALLSQHSSNTWLHLYCLDRNGQLRLEESLAEDITVDNIVSTKASTSSYFSLLQFAGDRSQIKMYSVQSTGPTIEMVFLCNRFVANPTGQDIFYINEKLFISVSSSMPQNSVYIFKKKLTNDDFAMIQRLDSTRTTNVVHFRIGTRHFLAVTSSGSYQNIYEWKNGIFRLTQKIFIGNGKEWNVVKIPGFIEQVILLLTARELNGCNIIRTYVWTPSSNTFELDSNEACLTGPVFQQTNNIGMAQPIYSTAYWNLDEAKRTCVEQGNQCFGILQRKSSGSGQSFYNHIESTSVSEMVRGSDVIYFKSMKRGFRCYYDLYHFPKTKGLASFVHDGQNYILITDNQDHTRIFKIMMVNYPSFQVSSLEEQATTLEEMQNKVAGIRETFENLKSTMSGMMNKNDDQDLNGTLVVNGDIFLESDLIASNLALTDGSPIETDINRLKDAAQQASDKFYYVVDKLNNAVFINGNQTLTGHNHFENLNVNGPFTTNHLNVNTINGHIDVSSLLSQVVRSDQPAVIGGNVTIIGDVTVNSGDVVIEILNGVPFDRYMTLTTDQETIGNIQFAGPVSILKDFDVIGLLNGIHIINETVTTDNNCQVLSDITFLGNVYINNDLTLDYINKIDLQELSKDILTVDSDQHVNSSIILTNDVVFTDYLTADSINGVNMKDFLGRVLKTDESAIIEGYNTFLGNLKVTENLIVEDTINGVRVSDLVLKNGAAVITGKKNFTGNVHIESLSVSGQVNRLTIPEDVMTLHTDQIVTGHTTFHQGFQSNSVLNTEIDGLVGGVNLTHAHELYNGFKNYVDNLENSDSVVINEPIELGSTIKGHLWSHLMQDVVFADQGPNLDFTGHKIFEQKVSAGTILNMQCVNGMDLHQDFLLRSASLQNITGTKIFESEISMENLQTNGMFGGLDVAKLNDQIVRLNGYQEIVGDKIFLNEVHFKSDLMCHGYINNLKFPNDVIKKGNTQVVYADKTFDDLFAASLSSDDSLWISGLIHGTNMTDFMENRLTLSTDQHIQNPIEFKHVTAYGNVAVNTVNERSFQEFADGLLFGKQSQTIHASHIFSGSVTIKGNLNTVNGINGFDIRYLHANSFRMNENNVISDGINIADYLSVGGDLHIYGQLNGVNLKYFSDNVLQQGQAGRTIDATLTITGSLTVEGDLNVIDTMNGIYMKDIFNRHVPQNITGKWTFKNDINILGRVTVKQFSVNGRLVDLQNLQSSTWKLNEPAKLTGLINFLDSVHVTSLDPRGRINQVNIGDLINDAVYADENYSILGRKLILQPSKITSVDGITVNGVHFSTFMNQVVYTDVPAVLHGVFFQSNVKFLSPFNAMGNIVVDGLVGGYDLKDLLGNALYVDRDAIIYGRVKFLKNIDIFGDLSMAGKINGMTISTDVVRLDGDQNIKGTKLFRDVHSGGAVFVQTLVNGHDFKALRKDTLMSYGNQVISVYSESTGSLWIKGDLDVTGKINGFKLPEDILTSHSEQRIITPLAFTRKVSFYGNVTLTGALDESVTIEDLYHAAFALEKSPTMTGNFNFKSDVTFEDGVNITGQLNISNLNWFESNINAMQTDVEPNLFGASLGARNTCLSLMKFYDTMKSSVYYFEDFVKYQDLQSVAAKTQKVFYIDGQYFMFEASSSNLCIRPTIHKWNETAKLFYAIDSSSFSKSKSFDWASFSMHGISYVVSADSGFDCEDDSGSSIYRYDPGTQSFVKHKKIGTYAHKVIVIERQGKDYVDIAFVVVQTSSVVLTFYPQTNQILPFISFPKINTLESFTIDSVHYIAIGYNLQEFVQKLSIFKLENRTSQPAGEVDSLTASFISHFENEGIHYLIAAHNDPLDANTAYLDVFVYQKSALIPYQKIKIDALSDMEVFQVGYSKDVYLAVVSENSKIIIFEFAGASGFRQSTTINSGGVHDISLFYINFKLFMAVSKKDEQSDLYSAIMAGSTVPPEDFNCG